MAATDRPGEGAGASPETEADAVKEKFKQALDRKNSQHRNARLHPDGDSAVHEPHGASGHKRQFRRKSG